jgi:hypothetical protein
MNRVRLRSAEKDDTKMTNAQVAVKPADVAAQTPHVAPLKGRSKKDASQKLGAAEARKTAKSAKQKKAAPPAKQKSAIILALIGRKSGATLATIMAATAWQAHSVRGFISLAQSKRGLKIHSAKNKKGERVYRVE